MAKYEIVYNNLEFIQLLMHIAEDLPTKYQNKYPYNLGYYHSDGKWSFDCWNLVKAILRGWKEIKKVGYYANGPYPAGLGDFTGAQIMQRCYGKSEDFSKITPGEFMMTPDNDHAGVYVGDFTWKGCQYNVVECTTAFGGGVVCSYVSVSGVRYSRKGGYNNGRWAKHGKLPWIDYSAKPEGNVIDVDGWWGTDTTFYFQKMMGTETDSEISNQALKNKLYLPRASWTSWKFIYNRKGSDVVKAWQTRLKANGFYNDNIEGQFGPNTVTGTERYLAKLGYYKGVIEADHKKRPSMGPDLVKAMQSYINDYFKTTTDK